jgi:hypothetical protein
MTVRINISKTIIANHLLCELGYAGYQNVTLASDNSWVQVDGSDTAGVTAIYNAHTGLPYASELRALGARAIAKAIPSWASWAQSDFTTWFNANISATQINAEATLADAKVVQIKQSNAIQALGQMLIEIRDTLWPDLQDR